MNDYQDTGFDLSGITMPKLVERINTIPNPQYRDEAMQQLINQYGVEAVGNPTPRATPRAAPAAAQPQLDLPALMAKYQSQPSPYAEDMRSARAQLNTETEGFNKLIQSAISGQADRSPSRAELYFQLAAAFGAPTRTGSLGETLGNVSTTLGNHTKATREAELANRSQALQLGIQAQQAKMQGAREDLTALRQLTGQEMKDKSSITTELLKDYVASGKPQSAAGKQALDEGFQPGSPPYQQRVNEIGEMLVKKQTAQIDALVAAQGNQGEQLNLAKRRLEASQAEHSKLTPQEMSLKQETEDSINTGASALGSLTSALRLNPGTFDTSVLDTLQRKALEAVGSKDPKVLATREQENLLTGQALQQLKAAFGGNPTEGERAILLSVQGLGAKSIEERSKVIQNAIAQTKNRISLQQKRLQDVSAGKYRVVTLPQGDY